MIGMVHLDLRLTVPAALGLAAFLVWYWIRLGRTGAPPGRRRIRRVSVLVMLLSLPNFVRGLSVVDPAVDKTAYLVSWSVSIVLVLAIFVTACLDAIYTLHRHRIDRARELGAATDAVATALGRKPGDPGAADDDGS